MKKGILLLLVIIPLGLSANFNVRSTSLTKLEANYEVNSYNIYQENRFSHLNFRDFGSQQIPGAPELPFKEFCVGVPPNGNIEVIIISIEKETIKLEKKLSPVPRIVSSGKTSDYVYEIDQKLYDEQSNKFIQIMQNSKYRFNNIVPIRFYPVIYDQNTNEITICKKINFEILIDGDVKFRNYIEEKNDISLSKLIVNYDQAKYWKESKPAIINKMPFEKSDFWYKFKTDKSGWFEIPYQDLQILPEFCQPSQIRMLSMVKNQLSGKTKFELKKIPIYIDAKDDDSFVKGDRILFERIQSSNKENYFQNEITFWITFGGDFQGEPIRLEDHLSLSYYNSITEFKKKEISEAQNSRESVDGIIIYPGDLTSSQTNVFATQAQNFALLHPDMSFTMKSQSDIFDEFGGNPDQQAIEDYLELEFYGDGSPEYPGRPEMEYVILLGSGIHDWNPQNEKNKIIVAIVPNSVASDDEFVDFNDDDRPDLIIGRIPAKNDEMMDYYLQRVQDYIQYPTPGFWRNELLFLADDEHKGDILEGCYYESGLNHTARAQNTEDFITDTVIVDKVLGIEFGFDEYQNKPEARMAQMEKINQGKLIWYFIGHGNEDVLGDEDYFRASLHMDLLDNLEHLPLFLAASCEVGKFDNTEIDCISEKFLFHESGGSIASIAATAKVSGGANTILMKHIIKNITDERLDIGNALRDAKLNSNAGLINSQFFNIMGDPILNVLLPLTTGNITGIPDSVQARQTINLAGDYENPVNEVGEARIYESKYAQHYENTLITPSRIYHYIVDYTSNGHTFYFGNTEIDDGVYNTQFIVPDDVHSGEEGRILNYVFDNNEQTDFLNCYLPMKLSSIPVFAPSTGSPVVQLWLDSPSFIAGDFVSTEPTLIAHIEDENGINILGSSGHCILLIIDGSISPIDITDGFIYSAGSATEGELTWQLDDLAEGNHVIELIVFDNYNNPTVAQTNFVCKKSGKVSIEQMLPYPNPMKNGGHFTFVVTEDSDITITIYTLTGRKIKTIKQLNCSAGYNQVQWNGKDAEGDTIANNTYFYKIKAKQLNTDKITEKIGKLIILK
ncbi:MAG: C25 family cysteine peptidase [Candidatus Tenebribacter davisii]|nr:C25 family cysteine peptidase [Candidatus Tenebribacter davisii]